LSVILTAKAEICDTHFFLYFCGIMLPSFICEDIVSSSVSKILVAVTVFLFTAITLTAQQEEELEEEYESYTPKVNLVSLGGGAITPQGGFAQKYDKSRPSFHLSLYRQMQVNQPLFIGFEFAGFNLDKYSQDIYFDNNGVIEAWQSTTSSSARYYNLLSRYYLPWQLGKVGFFAEFNGGLSWFYTKTSFSLKDNTEETEVDTDKNDVATIYGASIGSHLSLSSKVYFYIKAGYQAGLSTYYYTKKNEINEILDYTIDAFDLQKSTTDIFKYDIGITYAF
jgi:hypothetical protein